MAEINFNEYEHRLRNKDAEGSHEQEHESPHLAPPTGGLAPSAIRGSAVRKSVNASAYREAMLGAQATYGNRAVQRYRTPDGDWMRNTLRSGVGAATGLVGALPIVGNVLNASLAGTQYTGSAMSYAMGDRESAKLQAHNAQNNLLNAIPLFGNIRSGAQGVHDSGAFYNNLFGGGTTPPEISSQIYHRESGPKLDDFLSSLF